MRNTKLWIIILIILAIVIVWFTYRGAQPSSTSLENPRNEEVTNTSASTGSGTQTSAPTAPKQASTYLGKDGVYVVQYTDTGFVPRSLQIPRGKSVRFLNVSSRGLRVYSDNMTDPKLAELSASKTIGKGSSYTFSFIYSGLWSYHNEVYPSDSANIVVY